MHNQTQNAGITIFDLSDHSLVFVKFKHESEITK